MLAQDRIGVGAVAAAAKKMSGGGDDGQNTADTKLRHIIKEEIDVSVPKRIAYNQWTQFEEFSKIFKGIESSEQEEEDEKVPTAMELALRRAMQRTEMAADFEATRKQKPQRRDKGTDKRRQQQDELLQRTLQNRVK